MQTDAIGAGLRLTRPPPAADEPELRMLQQRLADLVRRAAKNDLKIVVVVEGWDAAGKSGAIRRMVARVSRLLYQVVPIGPPTDAELAGHFLARFRAALRDAPCLTVFDRSWYGRVLIERVERLIDRAQVRQAYAEIRRFESALAGNGVVLLKFWLEISPAEQQRRLRRREHDPAKQHKLSPADWRNLDQRPAYARAMAAMIARTDAVHAPWFIIEADHKRIARLRLMRRICTHLQHALHDAQDRDRGAP